MRLIAKNSEVTGIEGKSEPEFRLPSVIVGSVFVTVGLFWFAWTTFPWVHWIMPIIGSAIFGMGVSLTIPFLPPPLSFFLPIVGKKKRSLVRYDSSIQIK